jgi:hypothetical protein
MKLLAFFDIELGKGMGHEMRLGVYIFLLMDCVCDGMFTWQRMVGIGHVI